MTKKQMMVKAHKMAKKLVEKTGNYMIALKFALKQIWAMVKAGRKRMSESAFNHAIYELTHKPYEGPKFFWSGKQGVPEWLMQKNLSQAEYDGAHQAYSVYASRETAKAVLINFDTDFGKITMWAPKSVVKGF